MNERDLRQLSDTELMREAWLLDRKIARRQGEQIVDDYEFGAEWGAAMLCRNLTLTVALKKAGLDGFRIPARHGLRGMKAKRDEFIVRYNDRITTIVAELESRGLRIRQTILIGISDNGENSTIGRRFGSWPNRLSL